jgi:hypothetical protein
MKKVLIGIAVLAMVAFMVGVVTHDAAAQKTKCKTIQSGLLKDANGNPITTGYDMWGYNYQAMMFNGYFGNYSRPTVPVVSGDNLEMKWNDAWLSNQSCDGNFELDRHYGYLSYRGSGAWLTNHQSGDYVLDGRTIHWTYFVKIVAAPLDAFLQNGMWYEASGIEIGAAIWGDFAVLQEIYNDPGTGDHGILYKSPVGPGLGKW